MNSLSKLSKLKSIIIRFHEEEDVEDYNLLSITDLGLIDVNNNCTGINSIEFEGRPNITHKQLMP
jgi:hypothetical protein